MILITVGGLGMVIAGTFFIGIARLGSLSRTAPGPDANAAVAEPPGTTSVRDKLSPPPITRPAEQQMIVLDAADAELHGAVLRLSYAGRQEICYWTNPSAYVQWEVRVPAAGQYRVELEAACGGSHGGPFIVSIANQQLSGSARDTGGWHIYQPLPAGTVTLNRPQATLTIKPAGAVNGSLMNLRCVRLVPGDDKVTR